MKAVKYADLIIDLDLTLQQVADENNTSRSSVHREIHNKLQSLDNDKYNKVKEILSSRKTHNYIKKQKPLTDAEKYNFDAKVHFSAIKSNIVDILFDIRTKRKEYKRKINLYDQKVFDMLHYINLKEGLTTEQKLITYEKLEEVLSKRRYYKDMFKYLEDMMTCIDELTIKEPTSINNFNMKLSSTTSKKRTYRVKGMEDVFGRYLNLEEDFPFRKEAF